MQLSHIRYANIDFFKTPHIQIQLLGKDPVFKYEFLVLFINPCFAVGPAIGYSVGGHFLTFHTDFLAEARFV